MLVSRDQLGAAEWGQIADAVKGHPNLQELVDFEWSSSVLAPAISEVKMDKKNLGEVGAVVLCYLLQRSNRFLEKFDMRSAAKTLL